MQLQHKFRHFKHLFRQQYELSVVLFIQCFSFNIQTLSLNWYLFSSLPSFIYSLLSFSLTKNDKKKKPTLGVQTMFHFLSSIHRNSIYAIEPRHCCSTWFQFWVLFLLFFCYLTIFVSLEFFFYPCFGRCAFIITIFSVLCFFSFLFLAINILTFTFHINECT